MRASLQAAFLGRAAQRIWAERANPVGWTVRSPLGEFSSEDRITWRTADGAWTAELRRSRNGRHIYLGLFHECAFVGRYDVAGWHAASPHSRVGHPRPDQLPLRLAA
jgi:hypothetical protein